MADANSHYLASKTDSITDLGVRYHYSSSGAYKRSESFTPVTDVFNDNKYVGDTKPGSLYSGEYLKTISGVITTSTQSDSYNMKTNKIAVAVSYPTITASISPSVNFPIPGFKIDSLSLGITLDTTMKELASAIKTFQYNQYDSTYHYVNDFYPN